MKPIRWGFFTYSKSTKRHPPRLFEITESEKSHLFLINMLEVIASSRYNMTSPRERKPDNQATDCREGCLNLINYNVRSSLLISVLETGAAIHLLMGRM
ncbi:hypothetical protein CDAR_452871 [Caerostris darwini]|uniref:Uncharacterized protein n=1 Tax=Caerostris darwini TaxID=1538125 RepID=A0AAV4SHD5_9ARAC|nr:hypothetical protein CDAR_452871 [Caerostris darwini]